MTQPKEGHYNNLTDGLVSEVDLYSAMPAYAETLTEVEMVAVLAYIKTFWGPEEMGFQTEVTNRNKS